MSALARLSCACLPTPIEPLPRYSAVLPGVEVWIKRDDCTGFTLSGNKVRKLEFVFGAALRDGATGVITCGGIDSNHCRATTYLARRFGLDVHLFLRTPDGRAPATFEGNTLLNIIAGATVTWITPAQYAERQELMTRHAAGSPGQWWVIPEGASDARGAQGYVVAAAEIEAQASAAGIVFDAVVHAVGSGGTSAGLLAGRQQCGAGWQVIGFPVCDDAATFRARIAAIVADMPGTDPACSTALDLIDGYQGRGYGLTTPEELTWMREMVQAEGILLDPCYTGKAFYGLHHEIRAGRFVRGSRLLFLHTGGGFANFSHGAAWNDVLRPAAS